MSLLFWKNNKIIDSFSQTLADELFSYVNPDVARQHLSGGSGLTRKQAQKVSQKFTDVVLQIQRFSASKSLGIYGKARLQQKFDERLTELGYPADIVKKVSERILTLNV
jgi:hypothetical protein